MPIKSKTLWKRAIVKGIIYLTPVHRKSPKLPSNKLGIGWRDGLAQFSSGLHPIYPHCSRALDAAEIVTTHCYKLSARAVSPMRIGSPMPAAFQLPNWETGLKESVAEHTKIEHGPAETHWIDKRGTWHILNHIGDAGYFQSLPQSWDHAIVCAWISNSLAFHDLSGLAEALARRAGPDEVIGVASALAGVAIKPIPIFVTTIKVTCSDAIRAIERKGQSVSLDKRERIGWLGPNVYSGDLGLGPGSVQTHSRAARSAAKVKHSFWMQFSSPCASAFSRPSTSVWVDTSEPRRLSCPEPAGHSSCRQPIVSQTLSVNCGDKRIQPLQSVPRHPTALD